MKGLSFVYGKKIIYFLHLSLLWFIVLLLVSSRKKDNKSKQKRKKKTQTIKQLFQSEIAATEELL